MTASKWLQTAWLLTLLGAPGLAGAEYIFTAPPRETAELGAYYYQPIAEYLTRATGQEFVYRHPGTWTAYTKDMQAGRYDLVFDGSHFVSWRTEHAHHVVLAKLPQPMVWVIVARRDDPFIHEVGDLMGRKVCAPSPPNLGMLTLWSHFPNPVREPVQLRTLSWKDGFEAMLQGRCHGAVLPRTNCSIPAASARRCSTPTRPCPTTPSPPDRASTRRSSASSGRCCSRRRGRRPPAACGRVLPPAGPWWGPPTPSSRA